MTKCIDELMEAIDSYIPEPQREVDKPFLMAVEDVFSIEGRGTVATGRIERGMVKVGDEVEIVGFSPESRKTVCTGVEMFNKTLDSGQAGDNVGCLLRGIKREDIERGQVLAKPGSITPHTNFEAEVYVLSKEEGGRHTPFFSGYRPQFYFRTTDVTGTANLLGDAEMCMPGDNVRAQRRVDLADRHGRQRAFRHPRGRPHRRLRRRHQDHQVRVDDKTMRDVHCGEMGRPGVKVAGKTMGPRHRGVAQLVEHWSPKPAVGSSSPPAPAIDDSLTATERGPISGEWIAFRGNVRAGVYKRSQGRITRQVTFAALAIGIAIGMWRLSDVFMAGTQLPWAGKRRLDALRFGVPGLLLLVGLWICYRVVNIPASPTSSSPSKPK